MDKLNPGHGGYEPPTWGTTTVAGSSTFLRWIEDELMSLGDDDSAVDGGKALEERRRTGAVAADALSDATWAEDDFVLLEDEASSVDGGKALEERRRTISLAVAAGAVATETLTAPSNSRWTPRTDITIDAALAKMRKNTAKAITEHIFRAMTEEEKAVYADIASVLTVPVEEGIATLSFSHTEFVEANRRHRPAMEDKHLYLEMPQGVLTAVFDGHGGSDVSNYAAKEFEKRFPSQLILCAGNVFLAFETLLDHLNIEVIRGLSGFQGSTATITFIDKTSHLAYTATVGDSKSTVYRKNRGELKAIPLSPIRDWAHPKEALRVAIATDKPWVATEWPKRVSELSFPGVKDLRYPIGVGVNVSRALGDFFCRGTVEKPAVIHKPKITVAQLQPGDVLIIACDGLWDFVTEDKIVRIISESGPDVDIARALGLQALTISTDNITILAIKIR